MTNKQRTGTELSERLEVNTVLVQMPENERAKLLDSIECLQAVLYRFTPLLDSESVAVVTQTQAALETIRAEISLVFALQNTRNSRKQLQNWENEGGRIEFATV
jgi:hypothetical protein